METLPNIANKSDLIRQSREGLKKTQFLQIQASTGMTLTEFCSYLDITPRTIQHKSPDAKLPKDISAKILAISMLYAKGETVFGQKNKFKQWMDTPNLAIGGVKPISYLDLIEGINLIMDELTAIEHGFTV